MARSTFDVIVIGAGGMGSAAAYELARRGRSVLLLEQFPLVHERGSSHGHTRIIRRAYYEHPAYVPLVRRSFERWYDLEQRTGRHLLTECACIGIGPPEGEVVSGVLAAAHEHGLAVERLSPIELRHQFPQFCFDDGYAGVLEHDAGFLYVEDCVRAHLDSARELGVSIHPEEPVTEWRVESGSVRVTTVRDTYHAANLVITAGPWAGQMLGNVGQQLRVMRQTMLWFETTDLAAFRRDLMPIFLAEVSGGPFYGLPAIDARGLKVARHYGAPEMTSPSELNGDVSPADEAPVRDFLAKHIPDANGPRTAGKTCIYTLTPDRHFLMGLHPEYPNVAVAGGFSGHGFKFAPVVGEILSDLVDRRQTQWNIEMFRFGRW
ncbi:MAG TPA: N-methyl-L-tryptophan oxidase [Gemmataceae bacterium]|jgi:sarcosine oxidase|nr:N-methyl-L-tryptophan oxidase [Gemmataceae bacterium]